MHFMGGDGKNRGVVLIGHFRISAGMMLRVTSINTAPELDLSSARMIISQHGHKPSHLI